jgi:tRNA pseudouridine55 synthase
MDGVLIVDKPAGLTSHDVVAAVRRALRERRVGHTGTLDPMATGVLALACGRATRLVRFLTATDKQYEAAIRFGMATDSCDITGHVVSRSDVRPDRQSVERGIESLTGKYLQTPPAVSAKKVAGQRAYALARRDEPVVLSPVPVNVTSAELLELAGDTARVRLVCSAGFYVRSFARTLGERVGSVGCLAALRRTRSGEFTVDDSLALADILRAPATAAARVIPLDDLLRGFPAFQLSSEQTRRVSHGQAVMAAATEQGAAAGTEWIRLLDDGGHLVAVATPGAAPGSLHPAVVLI